jgi:hypothetical protein
VCVCVCVSISLSLYAVSEEVDDGPSTSQGEKGDTPIIAAARAGNLDGVNLLLEAGANARAKNKVREGGQRALSCVLGQVHDMRRIGVRDRRWREPKSFAGFLSAFKLVLVCIFVFVCLSSGTHGRDGTKWMASGSEKVGIGTCVVTGGGQTL